VDLCILLGCDYCDSIRGIGPKTALKLIREHGCIETILEHLDRNRYGVPSDWVPNEKKKEEDGDDDTKSDNADDKKESKKDNKKEEDDDNDNGDDVYQSKGEDSKESSKNTNDKKDIPKDEDEDEEEQSIPVPVYIQARKLFNEHEVLTNVELKWTECQPEALTTFLVDDMGFSAERVKSNIDKLQKAFKATSKPQMRMDSFFKPLASGGKKKKEVGLGKGGIKRKGGKLGGTKAASKKSSYARRR